MNKRLFNIIIRTFIFAADKLGKYQPSGEGGTRYELNPSYDQNNFWFKTIQNYKKLGTWSILKLNIAWACSPSLPPTGNEHAKDS